MHVTEELVASTSTGLETQGGNSNSSLGRPQVEPPLYVIFIHALQSGLFRIQLQGPATRWGAGALFEKSRDQPKCRIAQCHSGVEILDKQWVMRVKKAAHTMTEYIKEE